jgi:hypothetical protein
MKISFVNLIKYLVIALIAAFILIQLIPYGRQHTNPPVVQEPAWDSPDTRALAERACFDCHSNETIWPWYSNVAPVSWLVQHDVDEARQHFNFSEWNVENPETHHMDFVISSGEMPPAIFLPMHPEARLTDAEKQQLIDGLNASGVR